MNPNAIFTILALSIISETNNEVKLNNNTNLLLLLLLAFDDRHQGYHGGFSHNNCGPCNLIF